MAERAVVFLIVIVGGGILQGGAFLLLGACIAQIEGRTYGRALGATALSTVAGIPVTLVLMPFFPIGWILGVPLGFALNALASIFARAVKRRFVLAGASPA